MTEEQLINETGTVDETTVDYIDTIKNLKQNTVDKAKYDQLRLENKRLLDSIVNGQGVENTQPVIEKADIAALRQATFNNPDQTNLSYVENALKLRDALIENGEPDPFLPYGKKIVPTDDDITTANRVAEILKECVDYAEGDSSIFTNELMRRTVDTGIRKKK